MDISNIGFPVLMLADRAWIPFLSGYGSDGTNQISEVEVAYEPDYGEDSDGETKLDEPALRLRTLPRRGWRFVNGHAQTTASSLQDLGEHAATSVLISAIPSNSSTMDRGQAARRAMADGRDLGNRIPEPPWVLRSLELDGTDYALWVLAVDDNRFCLVADFGPIVLTGTGRYLDAWTFTLSALPAAQAQERLRVIDDDDEPSDG